MLVFLLAACVSTFVARKLHDNYAEHPPLKGYCSSCGVVGPHSFHQSGMSWKKSGPTAVLFGALGLGVSSLVARNVYRCSNCGHLTLQCRMPGCTGMALAGEYYDDEFCGRCRTGNDQSKLHQAIQLHRESTKIKEVMRTMQGQIDGLRAKVSELERDRGKHKEVIRQLNERLRRLEDELREVQEVTSSWTTTNDEPS